MKYVLVLQFPADVVSFDRLTDLEETLERRLADDSEVDGHDFGSGEGNIFLLTNEPTNTFRVVEAILDPEVRSQMRVAYRELDGEEYVVLWPIGSKGFAVI